MKCQRCIEQGLRSVVYPATYGFSTLMAFQPFYDEDGVYHQHDPNSHGESWSCSNGHRWYRSSGNLCPAPNCSWNIGREDKITWDDTSTTEPMNKPAERRT